MKTTKALKTTLVHKGSTFFLKAAIIAIGVVVLALCIFALPATWRAVPGEYPGIDYVFYVILTAMYTAAIPFFFALHQGLLLLNYIDKDKAFSDLSVRALGRIAWCGGVISLLFAACLPFFYIWANKDDAPGLIIICMVMVLAPFAVTVLAGVFRRLLREAIAVKSENDLTV